jgi:hypothetical protein
MGRLSMFGASEAHPSLRGEHTVMEIFLIVLAVIAGTGIAFFLFVIEPRRKIYDYDPRDYDPRDPR